MGPDLVVELTVAAPDAELAADDLWQRGATALEWRDELGEVAKVRLVASFATPEAVGVVAGEVGGRVVELDPGWREVWRQYARPVPVGQGLVVAPAWRELPVAVGRTTIMIDPGNCFGSGSHPSTRLILAALDARPPEGLRVLDVGCGSGILSVAAALLGAARVVAVDIDPEAVAATGANAERNGVAARVEASVTPVEDVEGEFDLALVNVTAGVHAELGLHVVSRVREGGTLLLAGLLPGQWRHVAGAYRGATVRSRPTLEGWEGVEAVARPGAAGQDT